MIIPFRTCFHCVFAPITDNSVFSHKDINHGFTLIKMGYRHLISIVNEIGGIWER